MLRSAEDEAFVAGLVADLLRNRSGTDLGYGATDRLKAIPGGSQQIDVYFIANHPSPPTLVIIECKRLKDRIELSDVKVLKATLDDLMGQGRYPSVGKAPYRQCTRRTIGIRPAMLPSTPGLASPAESQ